MFILPSEEIVLKRRMGAEVPIDLIFIEQTE